MACGLTEVQMVGNYAPVNFSENYSGAFLIDDSNDLYAASEWSYLNSHRAYFNVPSLQSAGAPAVQHILIDFADAPDGIGELEGSHGNDGSHGNHSGCFDLSGRRVSGSNLPKGIYIIGGKKVVVK